MKLRAGAIAVGVCAALLLSACASQGVNRAGGPGAPSGSAVISTQGDPLQLVGSWQVDAPGQEAGSVLRLGDDLLLWSSCGVLMGDWTADHAGLFVATLFSASGRCSLPASGDPMPAWLKNVRAFRVDGTGAQLLDANGVTVARLTPGGHPTPGPYIAPEQAAPPSSSADLRARFRPAAPLPAGLTPATPAQLVGRWGSAEHPERRGFAELSADGSWTGSDGANGQHGQWAAGPGGTLLVVAGAQTAAGCGPPGACVDIGYWLNQTAHAGFDGSTLVLVDADGKVVGKLARTTARPPATPPSG